jgi:hypothetical protein
VFSKLNELSLPEKDIEILRHLYASNFDNEKTYESMEKRQKFQKDTFPIRFSRDAQNMLKQGILYISGRDKCLRPILVFNASKLLTLDPRPKS